MSSFELALCRDLTALKNFMTDDLKKKRREKLKTVLGVKAQLRSPRGDETVFAILSIFIFCLEKNVMII